MAPLGLKGYPVSMLLDHLLSACYMEAGGSCIPKCKHGRHQLVPEVVIREDRKYRR